MRRRVGPHLPADSIVPLLTMVGGGAIALGAWLPWMSYFAGLYPLRGVIGVNGRLLLTVGIGGVVGGGVLAFRRASWEPRTRRRAKRVIASLGVLVVIAAVWLLAGVRELTRIHASNSMLVPRPGIGLEVVLVGGLLLAGVLLAPDAPAGSVQRRTRLRTTDAANSAAARATHGT